MSKAKSVFIVYVQGFGDREDEFYNCGVCATQAKAEAKVEEILLDWEENGGQRDEVEYYVEESAVA